MLLRSLARNESTVVSNQTLPDSEAVSSHSPNRQRKLMCNVLCAKAKAAVLALEQAGWKFSAAEWLTRMYYEALALTLKFIQALHSEWVSKDLQC